MGNIQIDPRGRPQSRPVVITIFTHVVRPSVRPSVRLYVRPAQTFKIQLQSLPAGTVGWPSGSLMTPVFYFIHFIYRNGNVISSVISLYWLTYMEMKRLLLGMKDFIRKRSGRQWRFLRQRTSVIKVGQWVGLIGSITWY